MYLALTLSVASTLSESILILYLTWVGSLL